MRLKDKVAIVTGGGSGIGRAIALSFASEGASVVVAARTLSRLEETVGEIERAGGTAAAVRTDVSDEAMVRSMVETTIGRYGRVDVLVNNSGISGPTANVADMELDAWNEVLAVNLTGAMLCAREVLKDMTSRRSGSIVNISSGAGRSGFPMRSPYSVSKWGIEGLTRTLALEAGRNDIRVNCIAPGFVTGERMEKVMTARAEATGLNYEDLVKKAASGYALKRPVTPEEVAAVAVFLASDESAGITGQTVGVDAGYLLG